MNKKEIKKKASTTKFIMFAIMFLTFLVTIFSCVATWFLKDSTILITLIPCLFTECGVVTGFYFWKRKFENLVEFKYMYGEEFVENTIDDV